MKIQKGRRFAWDGVMVVVLAIGAGDKYHRAWLRAWLKNPKFKLYPMGYDFQEDRKQQHLALSAADAQAVAGKRYQADWLYRFNQNPLDFVPDSAAFVPSPSQNVTEQDVFDITAYMMTFKQWLKGELWRNSLFPEVGGRMILPWRPCRSWPPKWRRNRAMT